MAKSLMLIALDYDDTYTKDPELWQRFIRDAKKSGHEVICVTMRHKKNEFSPMCEKLKKLVNEIICTGRKAKLPFLKKMRIEPDIWIDDNPEGIYEDFQ